MGGVQHGGKITPNRLAQLLSPYQIYPRDIRLAGDRTPKGYLRDDFQDAWSRYLHPSGKLAFPLDRLHETPHSPQSSTDAGKAVFNATTRITCGAYRKRQNTGKDAHCGGCCGAMPYGGSATIGSCR